MKRIFHSIFLLFVLILAGCMPIFDNPIEKEQPTDPPVNSNDDLEDDETQLEHNLFIHMIDVGQGDSILIELPTGEKVLIDGGKQSESHAVIQYLQSRKITTVDYLVGTHPDEDHIGGLPAVIETFDIGEVYLPDKTHTSNIFERLLETIANKELQFNVGETGVKVVDTTVNNQSLVLEIISPSPENIDNYDNNNASIVMMLTYGEKRFLFMGDAEKKVEDDLLDDGVNVHADVLKVGHHGSETSSSEDFLQAVRPSIALISAGINNTYKHPHQVVLDRLEALGVEIYRTDELGTIVVSSNGKEIAVNDEAFLPDDEEPYDHVVINEIYPNANTGEKEWVELYNPTDEDIDISGYIIKDDGPNSVILEQGTIIPAKGFYVIEFNNVFNNTGDSVILFDQNETELDKYTYTRTEKGKSYYRMPDGGWWAPRAGEPTRNRSNIQ